MKYFYTPSFWQTQNTLIIRCNEDNGKTEEEVLFKTY